MTTPPNSADSTPRPVPAAAAPNAGAPAARGGRGGRTALVAAVLGGVVLLAVGTVPRVLRHRAIVAEAGATTTAVPVVTVAEAYLGAASGELSLPATVQGLHETGLYPRSNGYVRRWLADMGAQVRAGQTLAEIEMPELDQELSQARANLTQVEATLALTRSTLERWKDLVKEDAATRQELDEKQAAFNAAQASAGAARANVERLTALRRFGSVEAPFSGVITARNVDVGALVSAGATGGRPLFTLAQVDTVRVLTSVPQSAAPSVRVGQTADVTVQELGSAAFRGRVTRTAQALDPTTRTLLTEIQVENRDRRLLPGMFAQAKLTLDRATPPLLVPANTLMMRGDGPQVAVVAGGRVRIARVTLGRDYGTEVEVTGGLTPGATLVVNPGDEVTEGAVVRVAPPAPKPRE
jgi:RND family efflux transporter MFP subunit